MEWIHDLVLRDDTPETWATRREEIRGRIAAVLGDLPDEKVPLEVEIIEEEQKEGYLQRKIEYSVEPDDRVRAYLLVPDDLEGAAPAVMCLHGTSDPGKLSMLGLGHSKDWAYATELAQRGYVTMAPDCIPQGERQTPGPVWHDTSEWYATHPGRTIEGKHLWDHMRAVDLAAGLPEVDSERIASMGLSMGGRSTHYLAAFDERVAAAVIVCGIIPHTGNFRLFWARTKGNPLPTVREHVMQQSGRPGERQLPFEKHELTALIAPRPVFLISPFNDGPCVRTDQISIMAHRIFEVYRLLGADANLMRFVHGDGHTTTPYVREMIYRWLDMQLGQRSRNRTDESRRKR